MKNELLKEIIKFPRKAPDIVLKKLKDGNINLECNEPVGFIKLKENARISAAGYPANKAISHIYRALVLGKTDYHGKIAYEVECKSYSPVDKVDIESFFYYSLENGRIYTLGVRERVLGQAGLDRNWKDAGWKVRIEQARIKGKQDFKWIDDYKCLLKFKKARIGGLWEISVGKRKFKCVRMIQAVLSKDIKHKSNKPELYKNHLTETFIDMKGNSLLTRHYNGPLYPSSDSNNSRRFILNDEVFRLRADVITNRAL